jgi:glycosyltransferase involved in cell wall biosynthesis
MRVLVVSSKYHPEYSGSGYRAHNSYKRFKKRFLITSDVVSSSLENKGVKKYSYDNVNIVRISGIFIAINFFGFLKKIIIWLNLPFEVIRSWLFIRKNIDRYDLLHTFGDSWSVGFLTWYFARYNKPIIRELCNDIPSPYYPKRFKRWISPIFQRENVMVVAISPMLERMARSQGVRNIWQRPNPVNELIFIPKNTNIKNQLRKVISKYDESDIVLSYIANFRLGKNQLFLLKVLMKLPKKYKLILAGIVQNTNERGVKECKSLSSYNYVDSIRKYINEHGLHDRVQLVTKFIENPNDYMTLSDVYLFPSLYEGLGTPILEAQSCGIPIVANDLPGITDVWIKEGVAGYSVPLYADLWAVKIKEALKIKKDVLISNSDYILSKASSNVIDKEYFDIFNKLTR